MIRIVNLKNYKPKENEVLIKIDRSNKILGNMFRMEKESQRDSVCEKYEVWFNEQIKQKNQTVLGELRRIYRIAEKKDIALGCWCAPKRCHGESIKHFLEKHLYSPSNKQKKSLRFTRGNLLSIQEGVILHQVNNCGKFAKGLALQLRNKYPQHYKDYIDVYTHAKHTHTSNIKVSQLLGSTVKTTIGNLTIYGLFSQDGYGMDKQYTSYDMFRKCLQEIASNNHPNVYIPFGIGCGLAGGDWSEIKKIISEELPNAIIVRRVISGFRNNYFYLSNLYPNPITYEGITYQNIEAAFQAAKTFDKNEKLKFLTLENKDIRKEGKKIHLREDWEDIKNSIMYELCKIKFSQNSELRKKLLNTGLDYLEESNNWGDTQWGVYNGKGENRLGLILMDIREELKNNKPSN